MNFDEDIKPITYMKTNSADLVKQVKANRRPVFISQNGELQAVVQDLGEYKRQKDFMLLLRMVALGEREIKDGELISQNNLFAVIDEELKKT